MFCPKCGDLMEEGGTETYCQRGQMGLSSRMDQDLRGAFSPSSPVLPATPFSFTWGGTWFCPLDSTRMIERDGIEGCPACGRSLNPFLYSLIEVHDHRMGDLEFAPWFPLS